MDDLLLKVCQAALQAMTALPILTSLPGHAAGYELCHTVNIDELVGLDRA